MAKSPLIWFGGKGKVAEHIISRMPVHKSYIEPFGGAAHVIAAKPRVSLEVYNDIDGVVVNFIMTAIEEPERLARACAPIPYSRHLYETWKTQPLPVERFARAVRYFYMNRCGIAKGNRREVSNTGWRHSTMPGQNPAVGYQTAVRRIEDFSLRMTGVQIERKDFREIIQRYDHEDALFYIDPPYIGKEKWYAGNFTEDDHRDLAALLQQIKGKAIVSYYDDPLLHELYPCWRRETFDSFKHRPGGNNDYAEELLLFNWQEEHKEQDKPQTEQLGLLV
ncbi:DNA adenine methylase [Tumebacillus permanentifrigoris]|uniref:Site-specific DNA-adenine methylase n=1 Tax=Tumebacillus permanentifrigoris TaxID=378543 RepID=A0A316D2F6_9BACL|nr:DNA adenine methylase [Tumebacillus permanentifrigoris]PWK05072.1 site-specific DNA-adenine methylase [Tumebacillus permanentifrigoris]